MSGKMCPEPAFIVPPVRGTMAAEEFVVRAAAPADVPEMARILCAYADRGLLLPRTEADLHEALPDFGVCVRGETVVGLAALHRYTEVLAEIRSVAVREGCQRHGLGGRLVEWGVSRAAEVGMTRMFALTYRVRFFERLGFARIPRASLPEKVWGDCFRCPKAQFCDEIALARAVRSPVNASGTVV